MRRNRSQHEIINQPMSMSGSGPLMTNHLRDLDIELEILKRKRDIIQQEQDMLSRGRYMSERQYDYQQPSNSYNRQGPKTNSQQYNINNYSQLYEGPSNSGNYRPQGMKRPFQGQIWQSSAKRFNAPKNNPWDDALEQGYQRPQPKPVRFSAPVQGPRPLLKKSYQPPPPHKQFQPSKVTKPKPQEVPNKLSTYPVEKTKQLVAQTVKPANKDSEILRVDIPPTPQMKGRLELALGTIMKDMRLEHCNDKSDLESFIAPYVQRMLKHTIRTRIHRLMLNQHVGAFTDIIATYRNKYPTETDLELIQFARDARNLNKPPHLVWNQIDSDRPDEFFKKNMTKLIQIRLEDMFMKVADMYKYNTIVNLDEYKLMFTDKKENKEKENGDKNNDGEPKTVEEETENDNKKIEDILGQEDGVQIINEKLSKIKLFSKFVEDLFEQNIPKLLPKFKDLMVTTLFNDKEFLNIKSTIIARCKSKIAKEMVQETDGPWMEPSAKVSEKKAVKTRQYTDAGDVSAVEKLTDKNADEASVQNSESEKNENNKAAESTVTTSVNPPNTKASEPIINPAKVIPSQPTLPAPKDLLYVKLIGRPNLPARAVIYEFLNKYNPVSIKKHKSLANLLVLGFKDKENFNRVIEANETVVGESTLIIKASEQINPKKETPVQNKADVTPTKTLNSSLDDIITSDIDNQITDLLTTIDKTSDKGNDGTPKTGEDNETKDAEEPMENNDTAEVADGNNDTAKVAEGNNDTAEVADGNNDTAEVADGNNDTAEVADGNNDGSKTDETNQTQEKTNDEKMDTTIVDTNLKPIIEDNEDDKNNESKEPIDKSKANVKESVPATPTRASSRLANATPRSITTRRTSKLVQN